MSLETVLVTGGSRGIGRAIVEALAAAGTPVAFTYRESADEAYALATRLGSAVRAYPFELGDRRRADQLVREVEGDLGPLVGLVNNAGIRRESLLAMTSDEDWDAVQEVNLGGVFRCCRAVVPGMVHRRSGAIVNVASLSAVHGLAGQAAYASTKAGVLGLTRSLAREVGKRRIRVNAVVPGFVATHLTADLPPGRVAALRAAECLPDGVGPADVANAVEFLLSPRASAISGQLLVVDAGATA